MISEHFRPEKSLNVKLPRKYDTEVYEVQERMEALEKAGKIKEISTIDYIGLLWLELLINREAKNPRTPADREFVKRLTNLLDTNFLYNTQGNYEFSQNAGFYVDVMLRLKEALVAIYFSNLKPEARKKLNALMGD